MAGWARVQVARRDEPRGAARTPRRGVRGEIDLWNHAHRKVRGKGDYLSHVPFGVALVWRVGPESREEGQGVKLERECRRIRKMPVQNVEFICSHLDNQTFKQGNWHEVPTCVYE